MMSTQAAGVVSLPSVLPESVDWEPFPAFPPSARSASNISPRKMTRETPDPILHRARGARR